MFYVYMFYVYLHQTSLIKTFISLYVYSLMIFKSRFKTRVEKIYKNMEFNGYRMTAAKRRNIFLSRQIWQ